MQYIYRCGSCESEREVEHGMAEEPQFHCETCDTVMQRKPQVAYFTAVPYHLAEGNRFHGDKMDRKEYDNKYNQDAREKRKEQALKESIVEAQMEGKEIATPKSIQGPSLLDVVKQAGVRVSG